MNYNHLYYFYTTARLGGVGIAAQYLKISQPSLSVQLKTFESQIGKSLFQKAGRGVQLTLVGERAFRHSQKIFEAAHDFEVFIGGTTKAQSKLRIGMSSQIESPFVADLLSTVYQKQNDDQFNSVVQLSSGTQNQLLEQLRVQQLDIILTNSPIYEGEFQIRADVDMPVGLFISRDKHKELFGSGKLNWTVKKLMADFPLQFVLPSTQQRLRHEIDLFLQQYPVRGRIVLESDILSIVARSLVDGVGVGFLPVPYVAEELKLKLLVSLLPQTSFWNHKLYVVARRNEKLETLLEELIITIKSLDKKPQFFNPKKSSSRWGPKKG